MSARTITLTLQNNTQLVWTLQSSDTSSGVYTATPPQSVKQDPVTIALASDGMMTGCGGSFTYASADGDFEFTLMNPYDGGNHHSQETPPGYEVLVTNDNGDNQDDWKLTLTGRKG